MADLAPDPDAGASGTEYQTIQAIRALGHEVEAVWRDQIPHRITHGNLHYLFELPRAYEKLMLERLGRHDVIHVNQPHGYRAARTLACLKTKTVFVHRSHGLEMRALRDLAPWRERYEPDRRPGWRRLASNAMLDALAAHSRAIAAYADGHIVSAGECRDFLNQELKVPLDRIAVIPQAPPRLFLDKPVAPMTRDRMKRVLYASQFAFFKAPVVAAEVINQLCGADGELAFTWVCSRAHHEQVRHLLSEDARKRTTMLDWMHQAQLLETYDQHGFFLFPSFFEGFGKVFLEAMSRGLCVIAADNSGAHDVIVNEVTGMLTPTGDADAMAQACLRVASDVPVAAAISQAAAESARAYTWERVARETIEFYKRLCQVKARALA